jgi:DNA-binding MarR family transcriptional regulator
MTTRTANLLGALAVAINDRLGEATAATAGRSAMTPAALVTLYNTPGASIGELARVLSLSHPGAVRLVDRLADDGFVERHSATDGRVVVLHLTAKGRRVAQRVLGSRAGVLDGAIQSLSPADRDVLERLVGDLLGAITRDADEADHTCRLCDEASCPLADCPVECAVAGRR